ncbi:hypothetical protein ACWDV4_05655 [Micromonospora sp. NPDC003197]
MEAVFSLVGVALFGFLAGLWAFRAKSRWCPECGATTSELIAKRQTKQRPQTKQHTQPVDERTDPTRES